MNKFTEKLREIAKILFYGFGIFGILIFGGFLIYTFEGVESMPMVVISQSIKYIAVATLGVVICLTDVVTQNISNNKRMVMFFAIIYFVGLIFFQYTAPNGPFDGMKYFISFSLWIITVSGTFFIGWFIYRRILEEDYNKSLENYKKGIANIKDER